MGRAYYSNTYNSSCVIDSVSLWKKVLTSTEKAKLYNLGNGIDYQFDNQPLPFVATGGINCSGIADVDVDGTFEESGTGGIELGGEAPVTVIRTIVPDGGVECSGEAVTTLITMFGGVEVDGHSWANNLFPCKGEIFIPTSGLYELIIRAWANIYEDIEIHLFTDIDLIDDLSAVKTENDFTTWNYFTIEKESFIATIIEAGKVALDGGVSTDYSIIWDEEAWGEEVIIYGYAAVGAETRRLYWLNWFGLRTISATNNSLFNILLPFEVSEVE